MRSGNVLGPWSRAGALPADLFFAFLLEVQFDGLPSTEADNALLNDILDTIAWGEDLG